MGFWDKLFKGKVYEDKRNPNMAGEMELCGGKYILLEFDLDYDKEDSSREYFRAYAVFAESVSGAVENWITNSSRKESGKVRFYRNNDAMDEGALFEIQFRDASCVSYRKNMHSGAYTTTIVISPDELLINGISFDNHWV